VLVADAVVAISNVAQNRRGDAVVAGLSAAGGLWLHGFDGAEGTWSAPQLVSADSPEDRALHYFISVTLDDAGRAGVLWRPGTDSWGDIRFSWCD